MVNQAVGQLGDRRAQPHRQRARVQATVQEARLIVQQPAGYDPFHTCKKGETFKDPSEGWSAGIECSATYDFHHMELEFASQHIEGVGQAVSHHLQVLLRVV